VQNPIHTAARAWQQAGFAVVPAASDGTKRPAVPWKAHQGTAPDAAQIDAWFEPGRYDGLGIICGAVSGQLEMIELEQRGMSLLERLPAMLADHGEPMLWAQLTAGYMEVSPAGGLHLMYRVADGPARPNSKLASAPDRLPLIETRGEGGFVIVAPSGGGVHPSGRSWALVNGGPASVPSIDSYQRDLLHAVASLLDQAPPMAPEPARLPRDRDPGRLSPGDDYAARSAWDQILAPHDWKAVRRQGDITYWCRPGKEHGISASTNALGTDRLHVFTSSTAFEPGTSYSKLGALAVLDHGGDHSAAARALARAGYGDPLPEPQRDVAALIAPGQPARPALALVPSIDGSSALAPEPQPAMTTMERSEDGHANDLIERFGQLIRYCPQRRAWLIWGGAVWEWQGEDGGKVREYAKRAARSMPEDDKGAISHKRRALSSGGTSGCLMQARTDPRITVDITALDAEPYALNTPAGVVDLRTGRIRRPDPASMHTRMTIAAPDDEPDADWERFLDDTFGQDHELRAYVRRLAGLSLIGTVLEQLMPFAHGAGANGKSTLLEALMHAMRIGQAGYAIAVPAEMLMIRKHSEHPAELAQLAGARLVVASELDDGQRFAEARIKQLTGRDSINARFLYGQPFTFQPSQTIWMLGNTRPQARTGGLAFWRRVKLLNFANIVPVERRDPALGDKLNAAAGAVLAWAVAGAVDYLEGGVREPRTVSAATESYAADQDTVGRFVDDMCHLANSELVKTPVGTLRAQYDAWCREAGEEPVSARRLTQELSDRYGVRSIASNSKRHYVGVALLRADGDDADAPGDRYGDDR
jgi:putative DNA primase/helicase